MYDISIRSGGKKWQPDAGDPVRVTVDLDEPVVATSSSLGVAHLADDGTVEELASGKYGFTYNADKTAVTAFWFDATGAMATGWQQIGGAWYYFYANGAMATGTVAVDGRLSVFDGSGAWQYYAD